MNNCATFENRRLFSNSVYYKVTLETDTDYKNIILNIEDMFPKISLINNFAFVKAGSFVFPNGEKLFIKKYEKRDFFYRLEFIARKTRAENFWHTSIVLEKNNIFHPKVYAALVKKKIGLFDGAYVVTEWIQNTFCPDHSSEVFQNDKKSDLFLSDVVNLLCKIHKAGIFHSDTKLYNFFVALGTDGKNRLGIWDLDGAVFYKKLPTKKRYTDLGRLTASFFEFYIKHKTCVDKNDFIDRILHLYEEGSGIKLNKDILDNTSNKHLARKGLI